MRVLLMVPSGGSLCEGSGQASWLPALHHKIDRFPSYMSGPNFNNCWVHALNYAKQGKIDLAAMVHADLKVVEDEEGKRWIDRLYEEMESGGFDFISAPMAIKDHRGLTSSGIGNPENRWTPWRRFTTAELETMPRTFTAEDAGYPDKFLLHNHGLCLWDMRKPVWYETDAEDCVKAVFNFEERIKLVGEEFVREMDSEDWAFSRRMWELGAKTAITTRIKTIHYGSAGYPNWGCEGTYKDGDEDTKDQWQPGWREAKAEPAGV
jgi:hypothetical protein